MKNFFKIENRNGKRNQNEKMILNLNDTLYSNECDILSMKYRISMLEDRVRELEDQLNGN